MPELDVEKHLKNTVPKREKEYPITYPLALILVLLGILIGIGFSNFEGFGGDLYLEFIGVIVTVGLIDVWNRWRDKREQDHTQRIINVFYGQMANSPDAHKHFMEMIVRRLLSGYAVNYFNLANFKLRNADLIRTKLTNFNMTASEWQHVDFSYSILLVCDFRKTQLIGCCLEKTYFEACAFNCPTPSNASIWSEASDCSFYLSQFTYCSLDGMHFLRVNFRDAKFRDTSLKGCWFIACDMRGADFTGCNLRFANIANNNICDQTTIMPDGTRYDVNQDHSQWQRFTNPYHTDFQQFDRGQIILSESVPNYVSDVELFQQ